MANSDDELKKIGTGAALLRLLEEGIRTLKETPEEKKRKAEELEAMRIRAEEQRQEALQPKVNPEDVRRYLEERAIQDRLLLQQRRTEGQKKRTVYGD